MMTLDLQDDLDDVLAALRAVALLLRPEAVLE
jgi:hypothetical protein